MGTGRPLEYGVGAYYDDYPIICRQGLEQSSLGTAKVTLGLLGFDCSSGKPRAQRGECDAGGRMDLTDNKPMEENMSSVGMNYTPVRLHFAQWKTRCKTIDFFLLLTTMGPKIA